jgi:Ca2+-binding RTX toxin-like protein
MRITTSKKLHSDISTKRSRPRNFRPRFEKLEDRLALATAFGLSGTNLLSFDTASPTITQTIAITNVTGGETLVGIDFRPQNGHLYALGVGAAGAGTLYNVSIRTGVATIVGSAGSVTPTAPMPDPSLATSGFGLDFNPLVDRIRIITSAGQSFVVDPNTGLVVANAPTLNGGTTTADGTSYTNNQPNTIATTEYTIDSASDRLYLQNPATSLTTAIGTGIGFDFTRVNGFDIPTGVNAATTNTPVASGTAFAILNVGGTTGLYSINLVSGAGTFVGNVGNGTTAVQGMAIQNDLGGIPAIALDAAGPNLVRTNTATPGTTTTVAITGINASETVVGIDFRPQTGQLFGLGINGPGNTGTLYRIDPQTGTATAIGTVGSIAFVDAAAAPVDLPDPATAGYGFDFNPTVDRVRVTTSTGLSFRVNPNTGAPVDGDLGGAAGSVAGSNPDGNINGSGATGVSGAAYTNSFGQVLTGGATTLYTLDAAGNQLLIQNPPNAGTQTTPVPITLGGSPLDFTNVNGFDIPASVSVATSNSPATGFGFATLTVAGVTKVFRINLSTGVATDLGTVGAGAASLAGLTLADSPAQVGIFQFSAPTYTVGEAGPVATITVNRTGSVDGTESVSVATSIGTATSPADFADSDQVLTFAPGDTSKTFTIPIVNDSIDEADETVNLALSSPTGGATLGAQSTAVLTITDDDPTPTVSIADVTLAEGNGPGTTAFVFTVSLSNASSETISVTYATNDGTATLADNDYVDNDGLVTFAPGQTTQTITVLVNGDATIEADETFTVTLIGPGPGSGPVVVGDTTGIGTITNDDFPVIPPQPPGTAELFADPVNPGDTVLLVTGTAKSDSIVVKPVNGQIRVYLNGKVIGKFSPDDFDRIVVRAGAGNDSVVIAPNIGKPSELNGEEGNDSMVGTNGPDVLIGGPGKDTLVGLGGDDEITGDDGNDVLDGGAGNDTLNGGLGNDVASGGSGNDTISGDLGNDVLNGNSGDDTVDGGDGNDVVVGAGGFDTLTGGDGNDTLKGGANDDILSGGVGNDKLFGEGGNDLLLGEEGNDFLYGGAGRDILLGGVGSDQLFGEAGDDILVGGTTSADNDEATAAAILTAWTGPGTFTERMNAVLATGVTVDEDDAVDTLFGQGNQDWFLVGIGDRVRDKARNEIVT